MKIAIIGTGRMGSTLGKVWAEKGHQVFFGSREPDKAKSLAETMGAFTRGGSISDAVEFGQVILLAVVWAGVSAAIHAAGHLEGKIIIDCTLPMVNRQLAIDAASSGAQEIAKMAPEASVVKAFNTIYFEHFNRPMINSERISMFYCGDDDESKAIVANLGSDIGLDAVDCGPLFNARWLEAMAYLWIYMAYGVGYGTDIGFRFLNAGDHQITH